MSCDDICIDMEYDSNDNDFYREKIRRARRPHACVECRRVILPGESYQHASGKSDGSVWTAKTCAECAEIRKALVCGSFVFGGLWEAIEESIFPAASERSLIDCLAQIDSLAARDAVRAAFDAWKSEVQR